MIISLAVKLSVPRVFRAMKGRSMLGLAGWSAAKLSWTARTWRRGHQKPLESEGVLSSEEESEDEWDETPMKTRGRQNQRRRGEPHQGVAENHTKAYQKSQFMR